MNFAIDVIISFSIVIPAIIAAVRYKVIDRSFMPFLYLLWLSLLSETTSWISVKLFHSNVVNFNLFVLFESLLIAWQFKRWKLFDGLQVLYKCIFTGLVITWLAEVFFISIIKDFVSYFIIIRSLAIVLMSISVLNNLIVKEHGNLLKNSIFLICIGWIVFFSYAMVVEIFLMYGINESENFMANVYDILECINLFVNLNFTLAVLWIPTRQIFTMPS